jgi:hypothetical protein
MAHPQLLKQGSDLQTRAQRAQMHYDIACLRWTSGNVREAYEDLKEASRLDPNNMVIWQKYEEAYRAVQKTLAEEHLEQRSGGAVGMYAAGTSAQRPPSSAASDRPLNRSASSRRADRVGNAAPETQEPPPTFTFLRAGGSPMGLLSDEPEAESDERSQAIQERMFRGHRGLEADEQTRQRMAALGFQEATSLPDATTSETRSGLAYNMENPKIFAATVGCWVIIWLLVGWHYEISSCAFWKDVDWTRVIVWCSVIAAVAVGVSFSAKRGRTVFLSLSDGIKIICFLVIVAAVLWHKLQKDGHPERNQPQETGNNGQLSLFST